MRCSPLVPKGARFEPKITVILARREAGQVAALLLVAHGSPAAGPPGLSAKTLPAAKTLPDTIRPTDQFGG